MVIIPKTESMYGSSHFSKLTNGSEVTEERSSIFKLLLIKIAYKIYNKLIKVGNFSLINMRRLVVKKYEIHFWYGGLKHLLFPL